MVPLGLVGAGQVTPPAPPQSGPALPASPFGAFGPPQTAAPRAARPSSPVPPDPSEARLDLLFSALADPTRRAVLARLSAGPASTKDLAEPFAMALPSFIEHLRRLEQGGLIETWKEGRVRMCRLRPGALAPVRGWMAEQRALWEARLDSLEDYLSVLLKESDK